MYLRKKIMIMLLAGGISAYLLYAATNEQYDTIIGGYNNAFNVAYNLWQTPIAARPVNWEDTFTDSVQDARRAFNTLKLYWEHDKRTVGPRNRASQRIMTLTPIAGLPRPTDAVALLKQHEDMLNQLEAESEKLLGTRAALHRRFNNIKNLLTLGLANIDTTIKAAQNSLVALGQNLAIAADPNYILTMQHFTQAQQEIAKLQAQVRQI